MQLKPWLRISITLLFALALVYVGDARIVVQTLARCDPLWAAAIAALTLDRVLAPSSVVHPVAASNSSRIAGSLAFAAIA